MDISTRLQSFRDDYYWEEARPMIDVIKATLEYPTDTKLKTKKLVQDVIFITEALREFSGLQGFWWMYLDIASLVPPDHPWQDVLVDCLVTLSRRDDHAPGSFSGDDQWVWKNLPDLSISVRENWDRKDPSHLDPEDLPAGFYEWENFNSFLARWQSVHSPMWLNFPVWQLRNALEEPVHPGTSQLLIASHICAASEWLIRCASPIYQKLHSDIELSQDDVRILATGSLCDESIQILGPGRWEFWKKQLQRCLTEGIGGEIAARHISRALSSMEYAEEQA